MNKIKIAILASGRGSNFEAIAKAVKDGTCHAQIMVLITNKPDAGAIKIAQNYKIPVEIVERKSFANRDGLDLKIKSILDQNKVELVVLAGYMLLIKNKSLLEKYENRIINIHPSLLPAFPGESAQKDAFEYGAKISGLTIHFVNETLDGGAIIYQEAVDISECENEYDVAREIITREHSAYAKVIDMFARGKFTTEGRRVKYVENNKEGKHE
ncbi:phosphoribosylglycinamide formyltransferase [Candidatus Micrarchaeota archaeon]|nr:phosphoribosylglycinamide formyltransferase [Candidatus Micrarchaeota archaeon]